MGVSANPFATAAWVHYNCNVGGQTLYFMEDNTYHILSVFSLRYNPATEQTATDFFSSKEIQSLINDHIGKNIPLDELHNIMRDLKYQYIMRDQQFVWLLQKETDQ